MTLNRIVPLLTICPVLLPVLSIIAQSESLPVFIPGSCPVQFATGGVINCGTVVVPEDRLHPAERTLSIAVAVFRSERDPSDSDPLVFLDGGPGARTLDSFARGLGPFLSQMNAQRDVILFDYRGMGYSDPALTCPESINASDDRWVSVCRDRYQAQGVDVTDFTTRDNAADAADIVHALGYETYNVWGGSYGSSVAMTLLRDHPEHIRAAIVTALQPPQGDLQAAIPVYLQRTVDAISALCQADEACSEAFPGDLTQQLADIVERLNDDPLTITVHDIDVDFTGSDLIIGLGKLFKDETYIPLVPGLIATLYAGQYDEIEYYANALSTPPDPLNPIGAYLSMRCTDSALIATPESLENTLQSIHPAFQDSYRSSYQALVNQCVTWGARVPTDADRLPAITDTPVLIISGALDPYSSQEWLDSTLATLPNGHGFMLPDHLHYVVQNPCAARLLSGFIADPTAKLDSSCITQIVPPVFRVP